MKAYRLLPVLSLAFLAYARQAAFAQPPPPCLPADQLRAYLAKEHSRETDLAVLAFDHQTRIWTGYRWDGPSGSFAPLEKDSELKIPVTNKPRVFLEKDELTRLEVFVVNTNPLLFSTRFSGTTETSIEELSNLQKLAGLLGGFLASGVGALAPDFEPLAAPAPEAVAVAAGRMIAASRALAPAAPPPLNALWDAAKRIVDRLQTSANEIKRDMDSLNPPRAQLAEDLRLLKEGGLEIRSYLQLVENDSLAATDPRRFERLTVNVATIDQHITNIATGRDALAATVPICTEPVTFVREAIRLYRIPLPSSSADQRIARDQFEISLQKLADLSACAASGLDVHIAVVRDYLRASGGPSTQGAQADDAIFRPLFQGIDAYLTLVEQRNSALKTVDELLEKSTDSPKIVEAVRTFLDRRDEYMIRGNTCSLRAGVVPVPRNRPLTAELPWTKFGTETFQIVADSPFKDSVILRHTPDITANYEIQRAWHWDFDVDVGPIYTEIVEPVYTPVEVLNTATPDVADDKIKLIRKTDEKRRAGELAMFLSLQWRSRKPTRSLFSFGPQLGGGLNTDHPALFAGVGLGIGRYVKLGGGYSWQRVKDLAEPQIPNGPVEEGGAIRLRDGLGKGGYAFVSITIDELPFFNAP